MLTLEPELEDLFWPKCTCEAPYSQIQKKQIYSLEWRIFNGGLKSEEVINVAQHGAKNQWIKDRTNNQVISSMQYFLTWKWMFCNLHNDNLDSFLIVKIYRSAFYFMKQDGMFKSDTNQYTKSQNSLLKLTFVCPAVFPPNWCHFLKDDDVMKELAFVS